MHTERQITAVEICAGAGLLVTGCVMRAELWSMLLPVVAYPISYLLPEMRIRGAAKRRELFCTLAAAALAVIAAQFIVSHADMLSELARLLGTIGAVGAAVSLRFTPRGLSAAYAPLLLLLPVGIYMLRSAKTHRVRAMLLATLLCAAGILLHFGLL